jgi:hypothetical protein
LVQGWSKGLPWGLPPRVVLDRDPAPLPVGQHVSGLRHRRRREQALSQEGLVPHVGSLLDDRGEEAVSQVRIVVFGARSRLQLGLERAGHHAPARQPLVVATERVDQPRSVREQLLDRDLALVGGHRPIGSVTLSLPIIWSFRIAAAVNCFVIDMTS